MEIEGYCTIYNDLLALEGGRTPLTFSHSGRRKWIEWYDAHATELSEAPEALQGPYKKMPGYCARFCLIIHLTRLVCREAKVKEIDDIRVLSAIALTEYFKNHLRKVYDRFYESDMDRKIKNIIDWMQRHVNRISYRDFYRNGVAGCKHKKDADPVLWDSITDLIEKHRKLCETERRRLYDLQTTMTAEQAMTMITALINIISHYINDSVIRDAIVRDIRDIIQDQKVIQGPVIISAAPAAETVVKVIYDEPIGNKRFLPPGEK